MPSIDYQTGLIAGLMAKGVVDGVAGEIEITENGEYDVTGYETATVNVTSTRLPAAYQEVEYIESTGTQYIDTGIKASDFDTYVIKGNFTDLSTTQCMLGYTMINNYYGSPWFGAFDGKFNFATIGAQSWTANGNSDTNQHRFMYSFQSKCSYVDNSKVSLTNYASTKDNSANIYLFARHDTDGGDTPNFPCKFKMISAEFLTVNLSKFAEFIPCYRKSDNVIGMYDIVREQFFTNAGTGTFLKGADV